MAASEGCVRGCSDCNWIRGWPKTGGSWLRRRLEHAAPTRSRLGYSSTSRIPPHPSAIHSNPRNATSAPHPVRRRWALESRNGTAAGHRAPPQLGGRLGQRGRWLQSPGHGRRRQRRQHLACAAALPAQAAGRTLCRVPAARPSAGSCICVRCDLIRKTANAHAACAGGVPLCRSHPPTHRPASTHVDLHCSCRRRCPVRPRGAGAGNQPGAAAYRACGGGCPRSGPGPSSRVGPSRAASGPAQLPATGAGWGCGGGSG